MPIIEMYVPQGALDEETKRALHERISRQVLEVEGADFDTSPLAREITWMFIREQPEGSWSVGGEPLTRQSGPRFFTRVSTPKGALDDERRAAVAAKVHEALVAALGYDPGNLNHFCWIDDSFTVSGGGTVVTFEQLMGMLGLDPGTRAPISAAA
jgi:phenylpyruvate tautomerase PptA (4-oxalocrotonate tautomerase family)